MASLTKPQTYGHGLGHKMVGLSGNKITWGILGEGYKLE